MELTEVEAVWSAIGHLAAVVAVLVALVQGLKYLMSYMPSSKLEVRVRACEDHNKSDFEHIKTLDARINALEDKVKQTNEEIEHVNEGIQRIGKSQISLLRHFVTGNGQKEMEDEANDLTDFFIRK